MINIYVLIDPTTEEVRYVGWTNKKLESRLKGHLRVSSNDKTHKAKWLRSLLRMSVVPQIKLVQQLPNDCWSDAERYWISYFKSLGCRLTNSTDGGEGMLGYSPTEETREKIRQKAIEQMSGPEARKAVSLVHKGKTISEEQLVTIRKSSALMQLQRTLNGDGMDKETREKIRRSLLGRSRPDLAKHVSKQWKGKPKPLAQRLKIAESNRRTKQIKRYICVFGF